MEVDPYYTMDAPTQTTSLDHDPEAAPHPSSSQVIEIKADRLNRRLQEFQMLASSGIIQLRPVMLDTKRASSETRETTSPPGIVRTIYKDTGDRLSDAKTYRIVSEPQYDGLRNNTSGPAIEMNKVVKVIPPPKGSEAIADIEGHYMLDGEIVDRIKSETMTIRSQSLLREMKKVIYWPTLAFYDGQQKLEINYPYRSLSVHRHELGELLDEKDHELEQTKLNNPGADVQELERMLSHFRLVLQEVDKVSKEATVLEEQRHTRNVPVATFDLLWKLFSPGQNVFVYENDYEITARVRLLRWDHGTILDDNMDRPYVSVTIHLWYLDHDGSHITPRLHHVVINRYPGEKPISELPVQPDRFVDPDGSKHREIVTRGRKYLDLFKQDFSHALYDGYLSRDNNPYHDRNKTHFEGNVIIDPVQYAREKGSSSIAKWSKESDLVINSLGTEPQRFHKLSPRDNKTLDSIFEDDHCFLLPQWIAAFTIGARGVRNWAWLNVSNIKPWNPDRGLCDRIAMPKEQCDNIKALMFYRRPSEPPPDADVAAGGLNPDKPIPEKGEGRIILLHGSPGVGKTYTVECLAQWSARPLIRLSSAELSLDPVKLETNLYNYLKRAERWHAIVLIDEADIYLELRQPDSPLEKEAIVSVFLRILEYTTSLVFLTTNRMRVLDPAAVDRMSLIVHYEQLTSTYREKIYYNCIKTMKVDGRFELEEQAGQILLNTVKEEEGWSGREISSMFKFAASLAHYRQSGGNGDYNSKQEKPTIIKEDIDKARQVIQDVNKYYLDQTKMAKTDRLRNASLT